MGSSLAKTEKQTVKSTIVQRVVAVVVLACCAQTGFADLIKPSVCLVDTKTAMRWVRANAKKFGIDPNRIAAAGSSAGGHLASALAASGAARLGYSLSATEADQLHHLRIG